MMTTDPFSAADEHYMLRALTLARRGLFTTDPNPRVGCVLVQGGLIVGEGWTQPAGQAHAEIEALGAARDRARGATAYVTLEPCSHRGRTGPCVEALLDAGITAAVVALEDPNPDVAGRGLKALRAAGVDVRVGLLAAPASRLNAGFLSRMRGGRPWVRVKSAMSLDGRTALANGRSFWITGAEARSDVHRYRARSGALVTGIGTVLADDPRLDARLDEPVVPGIVAIMDSSLRCPSDAKVLQHPGQCLVFCREDDSADWRERRTSLERAGAIVVSCTMAITPAWVLDQLRDREVNEVLIEAGARLSGSWLTSGLVNEWVVYQAPHVLGSPARSLLETPEWEDMTQRQNWDRASVESMGADLKMIFVPPANADGSGSN